MTNHQSPITNLALWWRALRPFSFPASLIPALLGICLAWSEGVTIRWEIALLTVMGALFAHAGANLIQDYFDFKTGVDRPGTQGGSGVLVEGLLQPRYILVAALLAFLLASGIALPLLIHSGWRLVWLVVFGLLAGVAYALPRVGLKYLMLGDVAVFGAFGVGLTYGAYALQTPIFSWSPVLASIPTGLLIVAILHANNMRDLRDDLAVGVRTLASLFGSYRSRVIFVLLIISAYLSLIASVALDAFSPGALLALMSIPVASRLCKGMYFTPENAEIFLSFAVPRTAQLTLLFGACVMTGMIGWTLFEGLPSLHL